MLWCFKLVSYSKKVRVHIQQGYPLTGDCVQISSGIHFGQKVRPRHLIHRRVSYHPGSPTQSLSWELVWSASLIWGRTSRFWCWASRRRSPRSPCRPSYTQKCWHWSAPRLAPPCARRGRCLVGYNYCPPTMGLHNEFINWGLLKNEGWGSQNWQR